MAVSAVKKEAAKGKEAAGEESAKSHPEKKKSKLLKLLIISFIILGAAGGGAYWYFFHGKSSEPKPQPVKAPVFFMLEPFTVNLKVEENPQFLQAGLSLKVSDAATIDVIKTHMPEVRDRILRLLSSRKASELLTLEGKQKLSTDIVATINAIIAPAAPKPVPEKKAPTPPPVAEGDAAAPAAGEEKSGQEAAAAPAPAPVAPAPTPVAQSRVLSVLFTSFIIQ